LTRISVKYEVVKVVSCKICSLPGGIQGQAGCGFGQPGLVVGDPAHSEGEGKGVETT